jgi:hypothetical protein
MKPIGSNSPDLILRSSASVAMPDVSKDSSSYRRLQPSFETHRLCDAPQDERRAGCRYDSNFGNAVLVLVRLSLHWFDSGQAAVR